MRSLCCVVCRIINEPSGRGSKRFALPTIYRVSTELRNVFIGKKLMVHEVGYLKDGYYRFYFG